MAKRDQILDRKPGAAAIIGRDGWMALDRTVDDDDRNALDVRRGIGPDTRQEQDSIDLAGCERLDVLRFRRGVLVRTDKEHAVAEDARPNLDALHEFGEKRIPDVGNDHAQRLARPLAQTLRENVRPILKLCDRALHELPFGHCDRRMAIDDARDRSDRHAGSLRHIADIHGSPQKNHSLRSPPMVHTQSGPGFNKNPRDPRLEAIPRGERAAAAESAARLIRPPPD